MTKKISKTLTLLLITFSLISVNNINSEAISVKAKIKRAEILKYLTFLKNAVLNFGQPSQIEKFEKIKEEYSNALSFYYEATVPIPKNFTNNYLVAYRSFLEIQEKIEKLSEILSQSYINRTQELLQRASKDLVDISIRYHRDSPLVKRFLKNSNPENEVKSYNPKDFHKLYDKRPIIVNIKKGYSTLGLARIVRQKALDLENYLEAEQLKKGIPATMRKARIESYLKVIELARQAKINAIMTFQLLNRNKEYCVQVSYGKNRYMHEGKLDPVFDPRIPQDYVKDANDSLNRNHEDEMNIKIKQALLGKDKSAKGKCDY